MKAATYNRSASDPSCKISIHAAREGGDSDNSAWSFVAIAISIHAAREGGDRSRTHERVGDSISIHAAREGGDPSVAAQPFASAIFQSTPPVKAAT